MPNGEILEAIKKQLENHESRICKLESIAQPTAQQTFQKKLSIKEFLLSKKPKTAKDKTLVIGYYLERHQGVSCFTAKDVEIGFRSAKEPVPKNINDNINSNVAEGNMMDAQQKKDSKLAWVLTNLGEQRVEQGFEKKN